MNRAHPRGLLVIPDEPLGHHRPPSIAQRLHPPRHRVRRLARRDESVVRAREALRSAYSPLRIMRAPLCRRARRRTPATARAALARWLRTDRDRHRQRDPDARKRARTWRESAGPGRTESGCCLLSLVRLPAGAETLRPIWERARSRSEPQTALHTAARGRLPGRPLQNGRSPSATGPGAMSSSAPGGPDLLSRPPGFQPPLAARSTDPGSARSASLGSGTC